MEGIRCYVKLTLVCPKEERVISGSKCFECAHFGGLKTVDSPNGTRVFVDCGYVELDEPVMKVHQNG